MRRRSFLITHSGYFHGLFAALVIAFVWVNERMESVFLSVAVCSVWCVLTTHGAILGHLALFIKETWCTQSYTYARAEI